jgi:exodeoxyribonuclease VII small subunit
MTEPAQGERTFEESLADLEKIVHDLEDGQTGLEESLSLYERGVQLIKRCNAQLVQAELRILVLTGIDEEGQAAVQPFEHSATAEPAKQETKRIRKKPADPDIPF